MLEDGEILLAQVFDSTPKVVNNAHNLLYVGRKLFLENLERLLLVQLLLCHSIRECLLDPEENVHLLVVHIVAGLFKNTFSKVQNEMKVLFSNKRSKYSGKNTFINRKKFLLSGSCFHNYISKSK
jgi:hypothetical protein